METNSSFAKVVFVLALIATIIGFTAFSQTPKEKNTFRKEQPSNDSSKPAKRYRNDASRSFDQLDIELKQLDLHMDQLNEELKNLDFSKAQKQIEKAMKKLDAQKISEQVNASLKTIDWNQVNKQIDESIAKVDKVKMMEVKKEIEKAKVQIEKQKINMHFTVPDIDTKKIKAATEDAMKNARKSIEKAKEELQNMRDFTNALQSDGLIDKSKPYKIEVKEGELYINDNKQSKEVSDKYQQYYKKKNFTINMNEEDRTRI